MPRRLPRLQRRAMLELWDAKCGWCESELFPYEMEADHLIADKLDPAELDGTLRFFGIEAESFDVHALPNRAPLCGRLCNRRKSNAPLPRTRSSEELILKARELAPAIQDLADRYKSAREIGLAAEVVLAALESGQVRLAADPALEDSLRQITQPDEATPAAVLGLGGRPHTRYLRGHTVRYPGSTGETFVRDVWLISPPGLLPVALVLEYDDDAGTGVMNAAERLAAAVDAAFPGFTTVLNHRTGYDALRNMWFPVPKRGDGTFAFGPSLDDVPGVEATLRAAKLIP